MKLTDLLVREAIVADLQATTKEEAIREVVRSMQGAGHFADEDPEVLTRAFLEREGLGSTAIGRGVAVPHAGHPAADPSIGTVALSRRGVEFDAIDGKPVDVIVALFHPPIPPRGQGARPGDMLDAIKSLVPWIQDDNFLGRLRRCRTREEVFDLLVEADRTAPQPSAGRGSTA